MNKKDQDVMRRHARYGAPLQREAARVALQAAAEAQNVKEAGWSISHLCAVLRREGNGRPLTMTEKSSMTPRVFAQQDGSVQVFAWWDVPRVGRWGARGEHPYPHTRAFYTGPLAEYWRVTLAGETS